ncbi:MAG: hypothetical protein P8Q36_01715 [Alphaproteobacteria bacterium]|jgi:hypothetical protein|nr:hypothetical protein [Rhodospirillaceae bacterium]MDG2479573.1 hypothetical protein [Alphaproteobacteria bacterium]MBT6203477.1 hypothetical protein [Rhodospirillaceae bacterium]MBT6509582.1 hypothetical protein [Rhodospirillaceae bacterium]MBT7613002.1 hypothetical protein [Rhodospirillaceae bacterium]
MVSLGMLTLGLGGAQGVHAQNTNVPGCGTFVVYAEPDVIEFVDHGDEGLSAGDRRLGRYYFVDEAGNRVGTLHFVTTVLPPDEDGNLVLHQTSMNLFDNGAIAVTANYMLPDPTHTGTSASIEMVEVITGGTGDFEHATGSTSLTTLPDGRFEKTFNVRCP